MSVNSLKEVCGFPAVSNGDSGCWFNGKFASVPSVEVFGTTVAGDTSLVEWCWRRFGDPVTREDPAVCALSGRASGWA